MVMTVKLSTLFTDWEKSTETLDDLMNSRYSEESKCIEQYYDWKGLILDIKQNGVRVPPKVDFVGGILAKNKGHKTYITDGNHRVRIMKLINPDGEIDVNFGFFIIPNFRKFPFSNDLVLVVQVYKYQIQFLLFIFSIYLYFKGIYYSLFTNWRLSSNGKFKHYCGPVLKSQEEVDAANKKLEKR